MTTQTETLQLTVSGLPLGTTAALERIGNRNGRSVEDYLRELIEIEVQPFRETRTPSDEQTHDAAVNNGAAEDIDPLRRREYEWINQHRDEYAGRYVALVGDQLVAHAATLRELYQLVRASGAHRPFFARLEAPDELPFGGW